MSLRLKFGLAEVTRMPVYLDASVPLVVKNALVEGDWVKIVTVAGVSGMPVSAGGQELRVVPVTTGSPSRLSFPLVVNPQQPDNSVPGVGLSVAAEKSYIGTTDRFDPGLGASAYADVPLSAKAFQVAGVWRYGLVPATLPGEQNAIVAWGIGVYNSELVFRVV